MYFAFESVNSTAVEFASREAAEAFILRVVPETDRLGAPDSDVNAGYSEFHGWRAGTREQVERELGADVHFESAATVEANYAEARAAGYYD